MSQFKLFHFGDYGFCVEKMMKCNRKLCLYTDDDCRLSKPQVAVSLLKRDRHLPGKGKEVKVSQRLQSMFNPHLVQLGHNVRRDISEHSPELIDKIFGDFAGEMKDLIVKNIVWG